MDMGIKLYITGYYYASRDGFGVDFYLPEVGRLIHVTESLGQPDTRAREVRSVAKWLLES